MIPLLEAKALSVRLAGREVVSEASFRIAPGEVVGLVGPNGAGKSSLLQAVLGLAATSGGEVSLGGAPIASLGPSERAARAAYLPQNRRIAWGIAAWRAAALGAPLLPEPRAKARALAALAEVGAAALAERSLFELSGGEQARVLLARLFVTEAPLLILDEPVASLDPAAQLSILACLRRRAEAGAGVLVTLHDLNLALGACDRLLVMDRGRIVADAPPIEALSPALLREVFGLAATLVEGPYGPVLSIKAAP
jgi:iron complex transport system ATP-binding protein